MSVNSAVSRVKEEKKRFESLALDNECAKYGPISNQSSCYWMRMNVNIVHSFCGVYGGRIYLGYYSTLLQNLFQFQNVIILTTMKVCYQLIFAES